MWSLVRNKAEQHLVKARLIATSRQSAHSVHVVVKSSGVKDHMKPLLEFRPFSLNFSIKFRNWHGNSFLGILLLNRIYTNFRQLTKSGTKAISKGRLVMKRALGERCHYYILNILSDNWQNDGFRQLKAEMAHTPVQFVIHLNLASTCDENEGKGTSVHRLKHCHFNQVMRTLKSCNDKETCQKVCCTFRVFVSLILSFL